MYSYASCINLFQDILGYHVSTNATKYIHTSSNFFVCSLYLYLPMLWNQYIIYMPTYVNRVQQCLQAPADVELSYTFPYLTYLGTLGALMRVAKIHRWFSRLIDDFAASHGVAQLVLSPAPWWAHVLLHIFEQFSLAPWRLQVWSCSRLGLPSLSKPFSAHSTTTDDRCHGFAPVKCKSVRSFNDISCDFISTSFNPWCATLNTFHEYMDTGCYLVDGSWLWKIHVIYRLAVKYLTYF